ncbi:MAG: hypothetical protein J5706_00095 [Elusimicrobiales bacterium]|nr:hypothetical protein [Elusimicrobiales bacterium]
MSKTMLGSDWIQGAVHKTSGIAETVKALGIKRYIFYINKQSNDNIEKTIYDAEKDKKAKFYGKEYFTDAEKFKEIIADIKRFTE